MSKLEDNKIAARYARALFDGALEAGQLDTAKADLDTVNQLMQELPALGEFFTNPAIPAVEKIDFVSAQIAPKVSSWVGNLLKLMVENNRISAFPQLMLQFQALINRHENIANAEVITAVELDGKLAVRLQQTLQERFGFTRVNLQNRVEPGILGGVIVKIQDQIIDGSYSGRLEALKKQLV